MRPRFTLAFIILLACSAFITLVITAQAQPAGSPWSMPVNVSLSGAASQPTVGVGRNGVVYALWWDSVDGERYARGTVSGTQTLWERSAPATVIFGNRENSTVTGKVVLSPPERLQVAVDGAGVPNAIWIARGSRLLTSQLQGRNWTASQPLSENAIGANMNVDVTGTLRMAYIQSASSAQSPAGVYYATRATGQLRRTLVYSSTYFRTASFDDVNVSITADQNGAIIVAWNQVRDEQSLYSRSADGGRTWSPPQPVVPRSPELGPATVVSVASAPGGDLLLVWRDSGAPGCGFTQRRSSDGGNTWTAPERILPGLQGCPGDWSFDVSSDGKLWMFGFADSDTPLRDTEGMLAQWDGQTWSAPVSLQLSYLDAVSQRTRGLGCLDAALAGNTLALVGCDARNDVWSAQNAVALENIIPALKSPWNAPVDLSRGIQGLLAEGGTRDIALVADASGRLVAVWGQTEQQGVPATTLFSAALVNEQWSDAVPVLQSIPGGTSGANAETVVKYEQPALAANNEGKLHLVWNGGAAGRIFYSSVFSREATAPQGWAPPIALPLMGLSNTAPDIAADPRGQSLYVIYVAPYNESRGVYLIQSNDDGVTWQPPVTVFDAEAAGWASVDSPRLAFDAGANVLHAVWLKSGVPGSLESRELYYARSVNGQPWSEPTQIAKGRIESPRIAVASANDGVVAVTWTVARDTPINGSVSFDAWSQISPDGGTSWTPADRVPGFEQLSGSAALASDGAGQLYLIGVGRGQNDTGVLLFSQWKGDSWSSAEASSLSQSAEPGDFAMAALASSGRLGAVLHVNQLRVNGESVDVPLGTYRDVAPATLNPLPTFTPQPTTAPQPTPTLLPTATPQAAVATTVPRTASGSAQSPNSILLAGGLALIVIIVGAVVAFTLLRRR